MADNETILYVVTDGDYSDYSVKGIYSTQEKAEAAKDLFCASDIEEWTLDELPEHPKGMTPWGVQMDKDGNTVNVQTRSVERPPLREWAPYGDGRTVSFEMWAESRAHAVKIANERRVQLIASGEWTSDWNEWKLRS